MRIGIVGPAERAVAWENHLQPHHSVSEVIITGSLSEMGSVDACLLLDDSDERLNLLLEAIKSGFHTFFISKLPTDQKFCEKIYHTSEEANVRVQFSHWPTLAPASQWMAQHITKPSFIQITRELSHTNFLEHNISFRDLWIDELGFCINYIKGGVHHIDVNTSTLQSNTSHAIQLNIRFDSGATAAIFISTCARANRHQRFVSDRSLILDCEVEKQQVRTGRENNERHLFFDKKNFDPSLAAEKAVTQFLKSIQMKKSSLFDCYDLLQLSNTIKQIESRLM